MSDTSLGHTEPDVDSTKGDMKPVDAAQSLPLAPSDDGQVGGVPGVVPEPPQGMIPARTRRRTKLERGAMRVLATGGIIGIATALGAVLVGKDVAGWIVGLVIGMASVVLAAVLWSSRQL